MDNFYLDIKGLNLIFTELMVMPLDKVEIKIILYILHRNFNQKGATVPANVSDIAKATLCDREGVRKALKRLEKKKYINYTITPKKGKKASTFPAVELSASSSQERFSRGASTRTFACGILIGLLKGKSIHKGGSMWDWTRNFACVVLSGRVKREHDHWWVLDPQRTPIYIHTTQRAKSLDFDDQDLVRSILDTTQQFPEDKKTYLASGLRPDDIEKIDVVNGTPIGVLTKRAACSFARLGAFVTRPRILEINGEIKKVIKDYGLEVGEDDLVPGTVEWITKTISQFEFKNLEEEKRDLLLAQNSYMSTLLYFFSTSTSKPKRHDA